ncbi:T9SS type A sorting domain-containing protein [bacterium]|nr:T9SS type A sorting domain-containing protein [bacterium]
MRKLLITIIALLLISAWAAGQIGHNPVQDNGGGYFETEDYHLSTSIGQAVTGTAGNYSYTNQAGFITKLSVSVTIPEYQKSDNIPDKIRIGLPYPNPFNSVCHIEVSLPNEAEVKFKLYDLTGRELYSNIESRLPGRYNLKFDPGNLSSGVYLYRIFIDKTSTEGRLILVK